MMDPHLQHLQELQVLDSRIAGLERKLEAIPGRIQAIRDGFQQAKTAVDQLRGKLDGARKDLRTKEKELEYQGAQRKKLEAKLYEVKTNKEYSAALAEIEGAKVEKNRLEEEILGLMELQERLGREVVEGEARLRPLGGVAWRQARATYYGLISELDHHIGRLIAELKAAGVWERTLIVFTSDHAEMLGDHWA